MQHLVETTVISSLLVHERVESRFENLKKSCIEDVLADLNFRAKICSYDVLARDSGDALPIGC